MSIYRIGFQNYTLARQAVNLYTGLHLSGGNIQFFSFHNVEHVQGMIFADGSVYMNNERALMGLTLYLLNVQRRSPWLDHIWLRNNASGMEYKVKDKVSIRLYIHSQSSMIQSGQSMDHISTLVSILIRDFAVEIRCILNPDRRD